MDRHHTMRSRCWQLVCVTAICVAAVCEAAVYRVPSPPPSPPRLFSLQLLVMLHPCPSAWEAGSPQAPCHAVPADGAHVPGAQAAVLPVGVCADTAVAAARSTAAAPAAAPAPAAAAALKRLMSAPRGGGRLRCSSLARVCPPRVSLIGPPVGSQHCTCQPYLNNVGCQPYLNNGVQRSHTRPLHTAIKWHPQSNSHARPRHSLCACSCLTGSLSSCRLPCWRLQQQSRCPRRCSPAPRPPAHRE